MATTNVPSTYALIEKDGKYLFVLRSNTGFKDGDYSLPAGHVEDGETFSEAAVREAKEETNIDVKLEDAEALITQQRMSIKDTRVDVFFFFFDWSGDPINNEPDVHSEIAWFALDDLPENVMDYQLHALKEYQAGKTYTEYNFDGSDS